ncbi:30S ribosomal protein S2|nr:30S ribosomal protein S2 [archaeon]
MPTKKELVKKIKNKYTKPELKKKCKGLLDFNKSVTKKDLLKKLEGLKKAELEKLLIKKEEKPQKKKEKKREKKEKGMLVPNDDYLKFGVHIGTKNKSRFMKNFIYKIRPDGLAIFDVKKINKRLKTICEYLAKFEPEEILIVCKRENGEKPLKMLSMATGIKTITGRYLPGIMTNPNNDQFIEPKVVVVTDTWYDKQALSDAVKSEAAIIALTNTHTITANVDIALPCNNRGHKSLALVYWIIAREYAKTRGMKFEFEKEKFI